MPVRAIVLAIAVALLGAACGRSPERDVRDTLNAFADATAKKDYQTLCDDLFAEELVARLRRLNLPCELALRTGLEDVQRPSLEVRSVRVDGERASARVHTSAANQPPSDDEVRLVKQGDEWRIASLAGEGG